MKKTALLALLVAFFIMLGCEKQHAVSQAHVSKAHENSLKTIYPDTQFIEWEYDDGYLTAEFRNNGMEVTVWFDDAGNWLCIKTEMPFSKTPQLIQNTFNGCDYANWRIDDLDYIQIREDVTTQIVTSYYEFDVEKGEMEHEFIIDSNGTIKNKPFNRFE